MYYINYNGNKIKKRYKTMITEKYKIWDAINKEWFKPTYAGFKKNKTGGTITTTETKEILFSMAGDMFLHTSNDGKEFKTIHVDETQYKPCLYTGIKDSNERKLYVGDIVQNNTGQYEIIFEKGCFGVKKINSKDDPQLSFSILYALPELEYIGNKLSNPEMIKE